MSEWREVTLGDLCDRLTVGHVGKMADEYVDDGIEFLRSQNIKPFRIEREGVLRISPTFDSRLRKSRLSTGDVVVVRTGYPGTAAVVPVELDGSNCADLVVITPSKELNPHLLAAIFNSAWGRSAVSGQLVGSAQQHFNVGSARAMRVRLPSRKVQDGVANVLCSFNDLIENNRRRIEVLEHMAQAVYREWFVRFRYPGHEDATFVDSPLGPIPEGWRAVPLYEAADIGFGFSFKSNGFSEAGMNPVVRIRDVPGGVTKTFTDEPVADRYRIVDGDVLIGMDGDFHLSQWTGGVAWLNQRVARLRACLGQSEKYLMLSIAESICAWNVAIVGTTVAHLGKAHLEKILVLIPDRRLLEQTARLFGWIAHEECALFQANRQLAAIRYMLLPKLVSGQIDVSTLDLDALLQPAS